WQKHLLDLRKNLNLYYRTKYRKALHQYYLTTPSASPSSKTCLQVHFRENPTHSQHVPLQFAALRRLPINVLTMLRRTLLCLQTFAVPCPSVFPTPQYTAYLKVILPTP